MNVQVIFYSMYGHVWQMAEAVAAGAGEVQDAKVSLWPVPWRRAPVSRMFRWRGRTSSKKPM